MNPNEHPSPQPSPLVGRGERVPAGRVRGVRTRCSSNGSWEVRCRAVTCPALLCFTRLAAFLCIATGPVLAQVQAVLPGKPPTTSADWKLAGLLTIGSKKLAVVSRLEFGTFRSHRIIPEGDRYDDYEVRSVNISTGTILLRHLKAKVALPDDKAGDAAKPVTMDFVLHLEGQPPVGAVPANNDSVWLDLRDIPANVILELYGKFSRRNILAGQGVLGTRITVAGQTPSPEAALKSIEQALAKERIKLQPDGEKFVVALHENVRWPKVRLTELRARNGVKTDKAMPSGFISLHNMDIRQILRLYGDLTGRPLAVPQSLPSAQITFTSQTELTRDETAYALTMVMALNDIGIRSAPDGSLEACAYAELADSRKP